MSQEEKTAAPLFKMDNLPNDPAELRRLVEFLAIGFNTASAALGEIRVHVNMIRDQLSKDEIFSDGSKIEVDKEALAKIALVIDEGPQMLWDLRMKEEKEAMH